MPRVADPDLEGRILVAAKRLWQRGGSPALTMRAVARMAGTTTPTVYQRFRDKQDILKALRLQAQQDLVNVLQPARSPAQACQRYLDFAVRRPKEYELLITGLDSRIWAKEPKPSLELMKQNLGLRSGGSPHDHASMALALWSLLHGTASLLVASKSHAKLRRQLRRACLEVFETLIAGKEGLQRPRKSRSREDRTTDCS